jgi:hypothetical protein
MVFFGMDEATDPGEAIIPDRVNQGDRASDSIEEYEGTCRSDRRG